MHSPLLINHCTGSGTRTRTDVSVQGILSPSWLPLHHPGILDELSIFGSREALHPFSCQFNTQTTRVPWGIRTPTTRIDSPAL